ncbi:alpha/beta hydrolase [Cellulomonas bogoriensis 69B4 = DSM 16987]|uniref:Alpha/beta hydrolase n=1 Tax=Cellulomonas bogoriensis 69B4 = DSM 16987 TaxID=1386082 RepID=A0A0A0C0J2_9CELL|nr:alpha/beta hydrolase [Cellulomonas bogoriensis 69B4 = DSM 16987]
MTAIDIPTDHGRARAHLHLQAGAHACTPHGPRGALILGHGAGGGIDAPDLVAASDAANALGLFAVLVEQPYRVAGRRGTPRGPALDLAWTQVVAHLRTAVLGDMPIIVGGRSAGARVACRTATATGALAALCLAFPLKTPGRPDRPDRLPELHDAGVPVLVLQGERDPYGHPPVGPDRTVVAVPGDHSLRAGTAEVRAAVGPWLSAQFAVLTDAV